MCHGEATCQQFCHKMSHIVHNGLMTADGFSSPRVRSHNLALTLRAVRDHGTIHRALLAHELGLTRTSVTRLVNELLADGILMEDATRSEGGRGRPATPLRFNDQSWSLLGIEARVDHTDVVLTTLSGRELASDTFSFKLPVTPREFARRVTDAGNQMLKESTRGLLAVGVALPARFSEGFQAVLQSSGFGWGEVDIVHLLRQDLGRDTPVSMRDVSRAAALANARHPDLADYGRILHFQLGMGLGMALTAGSELNDSLPTSWGAIEHSSLGDPAVLCSCGRRGCVDASIGFARFQELTPSITGGIAVGPNTIEDHTRAVVAAAANGDVDARAAIDRLAALLANVLATVSSIVMPEAITIGGYPLLLGPEFLQSFSERLAHESPIPVPLLQSPHGDHASRRGTAMLALDAYVDSI